MPLRFPGSAGFSSCAEPRARPRARLSRGMTQVSRRVAVVPVGSLLEVVAADVAHSLAWSDTSAEAPPAHQPRPAWTTHRTWRELPVTSRASQGCGSCGPSARRVQRLTQRFCNPWRVPSGSQPCLVGSRCRNLRSRSQRHVAERARSTRKPFVQRDDRPRPHTAGLALRIQLHEPQGEAGCAGFTPKLPLDHVVVPPQRGTLGRQRTPC